MVGGRRDQPGKERTILDEWLPARRVPVHVLLRRHGGAWLTAEKDDDGVGLGGYEAEQENVLCAAVVAFENGVAERGEGVQLNLLVAGADKVVDDVRGRGIATGAAEPLVAG